MSGIPGGGTSTSTMNQNNGGTAQQNNGQPKRYRIVVLGAGGVGKSALTLQYVQVGKHCPVFSFSYKIIYQCLNGNFNKFPKYFIISTIFSSTMIQRLKMRINKEQ